MDKKELMEILPHRDDMLLLDEAYKNEDGSATGYYTVKGDEFFLRGHFPGNPIVPGVILCEMIAQSACVMFADKDVKGKAAFYTGLNNVKFRSSVFPGDRVRLECKMVRSMGPFYFISGKAYVGEKLCVQGDFSFAVTDANNNK